ncbi:hypothetical protein [Thalassomonas sp. RHCl1]|uniref:hypothetical protein n=1 Tax=Thalassomonas sp. RHCl1 TaxID=2995320 RepID=UPI00248CE574|nr:hypothetical protein [Thalassomonas sp. RHCl1]
MAAAAITYAIFTIPKNAFDLLAMRCRFLLLDALSLFLPESPIRIPAKAKSLAH